MLGQPAFWAGRQAAMPLGRHTTRRITGPMLTARCSYRFPCDPTPFGVIAQKHRLDSANLSNTCLVELPYSPGITKNRIYLLTHVGACHGARPRFFGGQGAEAFIQ